MAMALAFLEVEPVPQQDGVPKGDVMADPRRVIEPSPNGASAK
jgi:hypothetical protein